MYINISSFEDNEAKLETQGFSLASSKLTIENSKISKSLESERRLEATYFGDPFNSNPNILAKDVLEVEVVESRFTEAVTNSKTQVTSGFFYLINHSELSLNNFIQTGTKGNVASAIFAGSDSSVKAVNATFVGLEGPETCRYDNSGIIVSAMARDITL